MIALFVSSAFAVEANHVDFDSIAITANVPGPSITWLEEVRSRLCEGVDEGSKVECQVNTDFNSIISLCKSLKESDTSQISQIMSNSQTADFHALGTSSWIGCTWNSKTGWSMFSTNFSHIEGELTMYDSPQAWYECVGDAQSCGADNSLDSRDWTEKSASFGRKTREQSSYALATYKVGPRYKTIPSLIMQDLESTGSQPWYDFDGTRPGLARFDLPNIMFLSGTLAVFQGEFTYGILFQSITGHNYSENIK